MFAVSRFAGFATLGVLSSRIFGQLRKSGVLAALGGVLVSSLLGMCRVASAQTKTATTTSLAVTSGGSSVTTVASGSVVSLTASVKAGTTALTIGQVNFCDATVTYCTDIHLLGTEAVNSTGTATHKFVPGPGTHSYKAVFVQNGYGLTSASSPASLTVGPASSPKYSDITTIASSGVPGDYTLTATVLGVGGSAPPTGDVSFLDTSNGNASLATAALGSSTSGLGWAISQTPAVGGSSSAEVAGDFNGDGIQDLALLWASGPYGTGPFSVTILLGNSDGTFTAGPTTAVGLSNQFASQMIAGDFNSDGKLDLVILSPGVSNSSQVTALLGQGDGTFAAPQTSTVYAPPATGGDEVRGEIATADFNGDGKLDLVVVGDYVNVGGITILLGNGDGTFAADGPNIDPTATFDSVATGDFNGDGIPDVMVTVGEGGAATILLGKGDGTFSTLTIPMTLPNGSPEYINSFAVGDFNGDGKLDLAFAGDFGVAIFLGNGDGTFSLTPGSPVSCNCSNLITGDFNHDGKLDLVGMGNYDNQITLLAGNGDGTFATTVSSEGPDPFAYNGVVVADFNGDGVSDIAMLVSSGASILLTEPTQTATATVNGVSPAGAGNHLVEASYTGDSNYHASLSGTTSLTFGITPPVILPASEIITSAQSITISDTTPGATIYYYASGAISTNGYVQYTGPIPMEGSGGLTIQAYASETGYQNSASASASYTLGFSTAAATPVISLASGLYPSAQTVTLSDTTPGAQIYYSTNGTYPYTYSNLYSGPIPVSTSEILTAVALAPGYSASGYATAQYDIASSSSRFIYTIAGNYTLGYTGDGGPATFAELSGLQGVAVDSAGNVYIADSGDNVVRKVTASTGIITTIAGTGVAGHTGDNGPAVSAELWFPSSIAVDAIGNLYIGETGDNVVRLINPGTGMITTFAGNPSGTGSLGGAATNYPLIGIGGFALDLLGTNLYIANGFNVVEVNIGNGVISLPAGLGSYPGFGYLTGITVDPANNIYVSDEAYSVVRKISPVGTITVFAGGSYGVSGGDGGPATNARLDYPAGLASDRAGNIYIADNWDSAIREVNTSGIINTIGGILNDPYGEGGDGSPSADVGLFYPQAIASDGAGNIYFADQQTYRIRKITAPAPPPSTAAAAPVFSLAAGTYFSPQSLTMTDATPGTEIYVSMNGSAPSTAGQGYHGPIDITGTVTVQAIALAPGYLASAPVSATYTFPTPPTAVISTVAGTGLYGLSGVGGPAINARIGQPESIAFDSTGDLYIADAGNNVVWMVAAGTGNITIVAGTGVSGHEGDGGPATQAELWNPEGVAVDKLGNLYIADSFNDRIRMVAAQTGIISTVAGPGVSNTLGDGGPATSAFLVPDGMAFDSAGNLYIADSTDNRIRMITASTGIISTVAGGGTAGQLGDGGLATAASLSSPFDVKLDSAGSLYISDSYHGRIRKVDVSTGLISTIAGNGILGNTGDGGAATAAEVYVTGGIAVDGAGNVFISNWTDTLRKVDASTGIITTIAGNGYFGYGGDGGEASMAELNYPQGLALDSAGNIYFADADNYAVRKVTFPGPAPAPTFSLAAGAYVGTRSVSISDSIQGATFYYTTDGSTPTTASNLYSGSITVSATETLRAIAVATGYTESAVTSAAYVITPGIGTASSTVTLTPSATTITYAQSLSVTIAVAGASGQVTPTGTVTLTSGTYTSQQTLSNGAATFNIAAGALNSGADTLTAVYSGDGTYAGASGTSTVTVSPVTITIPAPSSVAPGGSTTATATFTAGSNYAGTMNLTCALTSSPTGAQSLPTCSLNPASITFTSGGAATSTLTVNTTAASTNALARPHRQNLWGLGEGGTLLAALLVLFVPSRRRRWISMLALVLGIAGAGLIGCGGGGGGGQTTGPGTSGTTAGSYTFTVTGTDSANSKITVSTTVAITVQ